MIRAVLFEPEIPPNTGNIARLCAAFDVELHLVEPLGFKLEDKYLKRAGLDYWPHVKLRVWKNWRGFLEFFQRENTGRLIMATTKGTEKLSSFNFDVNDNIIFGPETRGLPADILHHSRHCVRIPSRKMAEGGVRSLNLSSAAAIFLYTALLQCSLLPE